MPLKDEELLLRFTYHKPKPGQPENYEILRAKALELATLINTMAPDSYEKVEAIKKIEEAVMWANAAISRRKWEE